MNKYSENIVWISFGILMGTFVSSWLYFLIIGIIGLLFIFYIEFLIIKQDVNRGK